MDFRGFDWLSRENCNFGFMKRKASFWEQLYTLSAEHGYSLVSIYFEFSGPQVESHDIEQALQRVCEKHAILRSKMALDEESKQLEWVENDTSAPFSFEVLLIEDKDILSEIEKRAQIPIPIDGPFIRCAHIKTDLFTTNKLIFTYTHAIMDGTSRNMFLHDLMVEISSPFTGGSQRPLYLTDQEIFTTISGEDYRSKAAKYPQVPPYVKVPTLSIDKNSQAFFGMASRSFKNVSKLVKKCREENCTVQAALAASLTVLSSWSKELDNPIFNVLTPISLRPLLVKKHPQGEQIASTLGNIQYSVPGVFSKASGATDEEIFWNSAREYKQYINMFTDVPPFPIFGSDTLLEHGAYKGCEIMKWNDPNSSPPFTMILSNVGRIESLSKPFGEYQVIKATAYAAEKSAIPFFAVNTIQDTMTLSVTFPLCFFTREQIDTMLDESMELLNLFTKR